MKNVTHSVIYSTKDKIENKNRKNKEASHYIRCMIVDPTTGSETPCLLTETDIQKGITRAKKNHEDVAPLSFFQKLYSKFIK